MKERLHMFNLKPISHDAVPRALARAERYRLLNEPREAESICRDVLAVDPANQEALVFLILALTDLFSDVGSVAGATTPRPEDLRPLVAALTGQFEKLYYAGVIEERWAKALLESGYPHEMVLKHLLAAMSSFEAAEPFAPSTNDDPILRYNACVRAIEAHGVQLATGRGTPAPQAPSPAEEVENFDDDVPVR